MITPWRLHVKYERDPVTKDVIEVRNVDTGTKYASDVKHLPSGPISSLTFAGGATLSQGFNLRYEPSSIVSGRLTNTLPALSVGYTVSPSGLISRIGSQAFTYDKRDRLESAIPLFSAPYTFMYPQDAGTNWFAVSDRPTEARDGSGRRVFAFGYDDGSSMSAISRFDAFGATLTGTTCLVHDALGRLTAVGPAKVKADPTKTVCKSESDLSSVAVRFRYDARNRRVGRQDGSGPWKQYVFTSSGTLLAEMTPPETSGGAWSAQREYVWLDGRPLAQVEYPGPGGYEGYVYLFHVDHLGQPRAMTSTANKVVWSASPPRPYGDMDEVTTPDPANGSTIVTNLRLPGQYDERLLTGLGLQGPYYNWHRWYLPTMGRYMELDPIALHGEFNTQYGVDWYGYGWQNPVRFVDPAAFMPFDGAGREATQWYADRYTSTGAWYYWLGGFFAALWTPETSAKTTVVLIGAKGMDNTCQMLRTPPPSGPKPPNWTEDWKWRYPEGPNPGKPRWFDPEGGEWRWHGPDRWHPDGHWDHNPWSAWNSPWQNVPHP